MIKEGLQKWAADHLNESNKMTNQEYTEKAQRYRILVWEAVFKKIVVMGERDQPISAETLKQADDPLCKALVQIYSLLDSQVTETNGQ